MKKRTLFSAAATLLLFVSLMLPVAAEATDPSVQTATVTAKLPNAADVELDRNAPHILALEAELIFACRYGQQLDIAHYALSFDQLHRLFYSLLYEGKLPWYTDNTYRYEYSLDDPDRRPLTFTPKLLDATYDRLAYEKALQQLLADCDLEGKADWQKALIVHDRLALQCAYDETLKKSTGYDLLISGSTVCAGYSALYQDILTRLGIPCRVVISEAMNHGWNLVQLDGNWYHVDVTWDDPVPNAYGRVNHTYFLKTDSEMENAKSRHYEWDTDIRCTDTRFSDSFWNEVDTQILFTDANTCYYTTVTENLVTLHRRDLETGKEKTIYREKENFLDVGAGRRRYHHSGLSLRDGRLWVCTMESVISMDESGKNKKTEYQIDGRELHRYIRGFQILDHTLQLALQDHDQTTEYTTVALSPGEHTHSYQETVTAPSCAAEGYTQAVCSCGLTAKGNYVQPLPHSWKENDGRMATFFAPGFTDRTCTVCEKTEYLELPQVDFMAWIKTHWSHVVIGICATIVAVNLVLLLIPEKRHPK